MQARSNTYPFGCNIYSLGARKAQMRKSEPASPVSDVESLSTIVIVAFQAVQCIGLVSCAYLQREASMRFGCWGVQKRIGQLQRVVKRQGLGRRRIA